MENATRSVTDEFASVAVGAGAGLLCWVDSLANGLSQRWVHGGCVKGYGVHARELRILRSNVTGKRNRGEKGFFFGEDAGSRYLCADKGLAR